MNYLAHAWLARHSDDAILGAILGDFVFGQSALQDWPPAVRAEIVRHRRIDQYTDAHRRWSQRAGCSMPPACVAMPASCSTCISTIAWRAAGYAGTMHRSAISLRASTACWTPIAKHFRRACRRSPHAWRRTTGWARMRNVANVDHAVRGIATRLSRNGDKLVACLDVLRVEETAIDAAFAGFFPDLVHAAARMRP
jgi:acyl carrier protein phosphodiesterase